MRIAIVKLSSIGDIAQTACISRILAIKCPHISVDWFCDQNFLEILEPHCDLENLYPVISKKPHKRIFKFISQFFKLKKIGEKSVYNAVLDLQGTFKSAMVASAISTNKNLWGFKHTRDFLAPKFYKRFFNSPLTENVYLRSINAVNQALGLKITMEDIAVPFLHTYSDDILPSVRVKSILVFPSSSVARKNYSIENWVNLIKMLPEYKITLLYGSVGEKILCEKIANGCGLKMEIVGNKKLGEIKMLLLQQDCIIGSDTGILHIASGLGIKNITLYGPTPQHRTSIFKEHSKALQGNGDVNKIPCLEIVKTLKLLIE